MWVHVLTYDINRGIQITCSPSVATSCFSGTLMDSMTCLDRKLKSSSLFSSTWRKVCQFPGNRAVPVTRLRIPLPLLALAVAYKLPEFA